MHYSPAVEWYWSQVGTVNTNDSWQQFNDKHLSFWISKKHIHVTLSNAMLFQEQVFCVVVF